MKKSLQNKNLSFIWTSILVLMVPNLALSSPRRGIDGTLKSRIQQELSKVYPESQVEMHGDIHWTFGAPMSDAGVVTLLGDDSQGHARFSVRGKNSHEYGECLVDFSAWTLGRVAVKRIRPGDQVDPSSFTDKKINVALGSAHEYRGVILPSSLAISKLEAIQTIFEGQFLTSTAVRKIPNVRRGDSLQIQIESGDLLIRTSGIAQEAAYLDRAIKVQTSRGKKELTGQLLPSGIVEVKI